MKKMHSVFEAAKTLLQQERHIWQMEYNLECLQKSIDEVLNLIFLRDDHQLHEPDSMVLYRIWKVLQDYQAELYDLDYVYEPGEFELVRLSLQILKRDDVLIHEIIEEHDDFYKTKVKALLPTDPDYAFCMEPDIEEA